MFRDLNNNGVRDGADPALSAVTVFFDSNEQLIRDLAERHIDALVLQDPFRMGYESVKALGMKLKGAMPPAQNSVRRLRKVMARA